MTFHPQEKKRQCILAESYEHIWGLLISAKKVIQFPFQQIIPTPKYN